MCSNYTIKNIYLQDMSRLYYHSPEEDIPDRFLWIVLAVIVGVWWAAVHFVDWLTVDRIPWWLELLLIIPVFSVMALVMAYGRNPLHWWPLVWGTRVEIPDSLLFHMNYDADRFIKKYGGRLNICVTEQHVIFRRRRDAVSFCLIHC